MARIDDGASRSLSKLILLADYTASHSSRPQYLVTSNALGCQCAMYYKTPDMILAKLRRYLHTTRVDLDKPFTLVGNA